MPSRLVLNPQLKQSTINTANLEAKVRAGGRPADVAAADAIRDLTAQVQRLQAALRDSATMKSISLDSADIQDLTVAGEKGPGQLLILSGPPDYAPVGWDGTEEAGTTTDVVSFNGDTITTDGAHGAVPGRIVRIQGNSEPYRNGWFRVLTVPTEDTMSVTEPDGPPPNGTGGTCTVVFSGGWRREFAIGEAEEDGGAESAPLYSDPQGNVYIGERGSVSLLDALGQTKGFLGIVKDDPQNVSTAVNNAGFARLGIATHGYEAKDDIVADLPGVTSGAVDAMITAVVDANTVDTNIPWAGAYTGSGTAYRYRAVFWGQAVALGNTGYGDAPFRTFSDGSLRIGLSGGSRLEVDAAGNLSITEGSITIDAGGGKTITIDATNGIKVLDTAAQQFVQILDGSVLVNSTARSDQQVKVYPSVVEVIYGSTKAKALLMATSERSALELYNQSGTLENEIIADNVAPITSKANFTRLYIGGTEVVNSSRDGYFNTVTIGGVLFNPANYYTKAEADARYAPLAHAHNTISITGTVGTVAHTHTGQVF